MILIPKDNIMNYKSTFYYFSIFILFASCTTDSTSDLIDIDQTQNITYNTVVKSIMNNNCIQCHGATPTNGAPMSLVTYENVKDAVLNNGLIDRMSRGEGTSGAMPLGGPRLPQNVIDQVIQWQNEGFTE